MGMLLLFQEGTTIAVPKMPVRPSEFGDFEAIPLSRPEPTVPRSEGLVGHL
jgi:hypothetical protein